MGLDWLQWLEKRGGVIRDAPFSFLGFVVLGFLLGLGLIKLTDGAELSSAHQEVKTANSDRDFWKDKALSPIGPKGPRPNPIVPRLVTQAFDDWVIPQLGSPAGSAQPAGGASEAFHEHSIGIWLDATAKFYAIPIGRRSVVGVAADVHSPEGPEFFSDADMRPFTHTPAAKCPPLGGWAQLWHDDRAKWFWMGYRRRFYQYSDDKIFYQQFEHGIKVGPFKVGDYTKKGRIYAIMDDGSFEINNSSSLLAPSDIPNQVFSAANLTCK